MKHASYIDNNNAKKGYSVTRDGNEWSVVTVYDER